MSDKRSIAGHTGVLLQIPWSLDAIGGVSQVVGNLAQALRSDHDRRAAVLVPDWRAVSPNVAVEQGVPVVRMRIRAPFIDLRPVAGPLGYLATLPVSAARLASIAQRFRAGIINVHYPDLRVLTWLFARSSRLVKARVFLSFHGRDLQIIARATGIERRLWSQALQRCDGVTFCSESLLTRFMDIQPGHRGRCMVVHNGCNIGSIQLEAETNASPFRCAPNRRYLLSLGTFEHKKGHDVLLCAFESLAARFPDLDLVIAGRVGEPEYLAALRRQIAESLFQERIVLLPDVPHGPAMALLRGAEGLVMASRVEPFGIVALEASALGRPFVLTESCGVREALRPIHQSILAAETESPSSLAQNIRVMLEQTSWAAQATSDVGAFVRSNLAWCAVGAKYINFFAAHGAGHAQ